MLRNFDTVEHPYNDYQKEKIEEGERETYKYVHRTGKRKYMDDLTYQQTGMRYWETRAKLKNIDGLT